MRNRPHLVLFFILLSTGLFAQDTKLSFRLSQLTSSGHSAAASVHLLIRGNPAQVRQAVEQNGGHFLYAIGSVSSVTLPTSRIREVASSPFVTRMEEGSIRLHPLNDTMVYLTNVHEVHLGQAPLLRSYQGTGIVCGFIDTGIDFTHGDFKDSLGKTRIRYIWDQNMPNAANTPKPFNYGQEWNNLQIDSGLCTHTDTMYWGHGTRVAGTCAGNGRAVNRYEGVAPKADIIMVAVNFGSQGPTIADAATYIFSKADALGKPCVINCSLGSEIGSHDGKDLETQIIDSLLLRKSGRVFVAATGNSGNIPYHLTNTQHADTSFSWLRFTAADTTNNSTTMDIQIFGDTLNMKGLRFAIGADQAQPSYAFRGRTAFRGFPSQPGVLLSDTIRNNGKRLAIIQSYEQKAGNRYSLEFVITPDSTYDNFRVIATGSGKFDAWSMNLVSGGIPSAAMYPPMAGYKLPDTNETIETGFQCSPHVISVANYVNKNCFTDENDTVVCDTSFQFRPRRLAPSSGHGPTRTGLQKPDLAAPGDYVISCMVLSMKKYFWTTQIAKGGQHTYGGGTSQASPVIAGTAALLLEQNPLSTHLQIKDALTCSAKSDVYTGNGLPDYKWGYGKVDAFHALTSCAPLHAGIHEPEQGNLIVWPNPSQETCTVSFPETNDNAAITIRDLLGREISRVQVKEGTKSVTLQRGNLGSGVYFLTLEQPGKLLQTKKIALQ